MADPEVYETLQPSQRRFLAAFAACGSLTRAARWAKMTRQNHYKWIDNDPQYAAIFPEFERRAARTLEDEAVRRAHQGVTRPVRYKGKIVGYETEYSDQLLIALLKAWLPEKYRERIDQRLGGPNGEPLMSEDQIRKILESGAPPPTADEETLP